MSSTANHAGPIALVLLLGLAQAACGQKESRTEEAVATPRPDTSVATQPTNPGPSTSSVDTPPSGPAPTNQAGGGGGPKVSRLEYEGWREYSVHCARCHGQDALPNPVAANLLISLGPGGPIDTPEKFVEIVSAGRPASGMPAYKGVLTPEQLKAIYAYVKGRAEKRIPPGRPAQPQG